MQLGALNDYLLPAVLDEPKRAPRAPKPPKQRPAAGRKRLAEPGGWWAGLPAFAGCAACGSASACIKRHAPLYFLAQQVHSWPVAYLLDLHLTCRRAAGEQGSVRTACHTIEFIPVPDFHLQTSC